MNWEIDFEKCDRIDFDYDKNITIKCFVAIEQVIIIKFWILIRSHRELGQSYAIWIRCLLTAAENTLRIISPEVPLDLFWNEFQLPYSEKYCQNISTDVKNMAFSSVL